MRPLLHVLAALAGVVLAAVIVVLVFEQASREGARQEGEAPQAVQVEGSSGAGCATVEPAEFDEPDAIARAAKNLPAIIDANQQEVRVVDRRQAAWLARVQAAFGLCVDEIAISPQRTDVIATLPADTTDADVDAYTYHFLQRSFEPPLARNTVALDLSVGEDDRRRLLVRDFAWRAFQRSHRAFGLQPTIDGMRQFRRRVGYGEREMRLEGW